MHPAKQKTLAKYLLINHFVCQKHEKAGDVKN
jgi:hypothetical protein